MAQTVRLFVYGTLMRGEPYHHLLGDDAVFVRSARTAHGFVLLDLGAYPGMVAGDGTVAGELVEVAPAMLPELDAYEDCPGTYTRETIALDDGSRAVTYVLRPEWAAGRHVLPGGDWRARRLRA